MICIYISYIYTYHIHEAMARAIARDAATAGLPKDDAVGQHIECPMVAFPLL